MQNDEFSTFHPAVNFFYFAVVLIFAMLFMHPLYLLLALICLSSYDFHLSNGQFKGKLYFFLPLIFFTVLINLLFNHQGATILAYFPSGNPLTLESIVYAFAASCVLANLLISFSCFIKVIDEEKIIYLFGRFSPALALVLSLSLRFIAKFQTELKSISQSRQLFGISLKQGSLFQRLRSALSIFSIMLSWALENSLDTADSMRSRGYAAGKRSSFALYKWERRDYFLLAWLMVLSLYLTAGVYFKVFAWHYFPTISALKVNLYAISVFAAFLLLALTPFFCQGIYRFKKPSYQSQAKERG